ncbi:MAG: hypothetical protein ABL914_07860 [Novosphingobium sp.]|uniref:hypothetical protein n=1 Tax=Novosphingobium sp. TaxID=1874826 RepID=UPI0032BBAD1D
MRKIAIALVTASALLAGPALDAKTRLTPEQELAKLLDGRVAGTPRSCIPQHESRDVRVIDGTALVFGWGNTIWVNVPRNAKDVDSDDVLVTRNYGGQFCNLDIVQTLDRSSHMFNGLISLGEFVPYRRIKAAK